MREQDQEPTPEILDQVEDLIGSIDPQQEQPQSLVNKVMRWLQQYPALDRITDLIPQTRMVKAVASAVAALEQGNQGQALMALSAVVGGDVARGAQQLQRLDRTQQAIQQGDTLQALKAQGGTGAQLARGVQAVQAMTKEHTELERIKELAGVRKSHSR